MFISSLLASAVSRYEISSLSFFGIVNLKGGPPQEDVLLGLLVFSFYSLFSFAMRTYYEAPRLPSEVSFFRTMLTTKTGMFLQAMERADEIDEEFQKHKIYGMSEANYFPSSPDANSYLPGLIKRVGKFAELWSLSPMSAQNVIIGPLNFIPQKLKSYGLASTHHVQLRMSILEREITVSDSQGRLQALAQLPDDIERCEIRVGDIPTDYFEFLKKLCKKQAAHMRRSRRRLDLSLASRFFDVFLLPVVIPAIASLGVLYFAVKGLPTL